MSRTIGLLLYFIIPVTMRDQLQILVANPNGWPDIRNLVPRSPSGIPEWEIGDHRFRTRRVAASEPALAAASEFASVKHSMTYSSAREL